MAAPCDSAGLREAAEAVAIGAQAEAAAAKAEALAASTRADEAMISMHRAEESASASAAAVQTLRERVRALESEKADAWERPPCADAFSQTDATSTREAASQGLMPIMTTRSTQVREAKPARVGVMCQAGVGLSGYRTSGVQAAAESSDCGMQAGCAVNELRDAGAQVRPKPTPTANASLQAGTGGLLSQSESSTQSIRCETREEGTQVRPRPTRTSEAGQQAGCSVYWRVAAGSQASALHTDSGAQASVSSTEHATQSNGPEVASYGVQCVPYRTDAGTQAKPRPTRTVDVGMNAVVRTCEVGVAVAAADKAVVSDDKPATAEAGMQCEAEEEEEAVAAAVKESVEVSTQHEAVVLCEIGTQSDAGGMEEAVEVAEEAVEEAVANEVAAVVMAQELAEMEKEGAAAADVAAARYFLMGHEAAHEAALKAQEVLKAAADIAAANYSTTTTASSNSKVEMVDAQTQVRPKSTKTSDIGVQPEHATKAMCTVGNQMGGPIAVVSEAAVQAGIAEVRSMMGATTDATTQSDEAPTAAAAVGGQCGNAVGASRPCEWRPSAPRTPSSRDRGRDQVDAPLTADRTSSSH